MVVWRSAAAEALPLVLYAAYSALGWRHTVRDRAASELEWISERGCAACPMSRYCVPLYQLLYSLAGALILLAAFGIPHVLLGGRGAAVGAAAVVLSALLGFLKSARSGRLPRALAALAYHALGACAMALLWLHDPAVFALAIAADNALQALAAWLVVSHAIRKLRPALGATRSSA